MTPRSLVTWSVLGVAGFIAYGWWTSRDTLIPSGGGTPRDPALRLQALQCAYPDRDVGGWDLWAPDAKVDAIYARLLAGGTCDTIPLPAPPVTSTTKLGLTGGNSIDGPTSHAGFQDRDWVYAFTDTIKVWFYLGKIDDVWIWVQRGTDAPFWMSVSKIFKHACGSFSLDGTKAEITPRNTLQLTGVSGDSMELWLDYQNVNFALTMNGTYTTCGASSIFDLWPSTGT
jgi:hypothetical protein